MYHATEALAYMSLFVSRLWELDLMHVALMTRLVTMLCRVSASASTVKDMFRKKTRTLCHCIEEGLV